jgi:glutathione S-transferase
MKLLLNTTSPYARFARVVMLEKGLQSQVELVWVDPWNNDAMLLVANPVGRIPVLIMDDNVAVSESLLIAQTLNSLTGTGESVDLFVKTSAQLSQLGLGIGLMDMAFNSVINAKYYGDEINSTYLGERRFAAIERTLQQLNTVLAVNQTTDLTLADIAVAVALDYLDFRLAQLDVNKHYGQIALWRQAFAGRDSFATTAF